MKNQISKGDRLKLQVSGAKSELQGMGHRNYLKDFLKEHPTRPLPQKASHFEELFYFVLVENPCYFYKVEQ